MTDRAARRRSDRALAELYDRVPSMECLPGCRDCCGMVPWAAAEWQRVADRAPAETIEVPMASGMSVHVPSSQHALLDIMAKLGPEAAMRASGVEASTPVGESCLKCVFAGANGGCGVHPDRPLICRLFGAVDHPQFTCPHGCGPKRKLSSAEAERMLEAYSRFAAERSQ